MHIDDLETAERRQIFYSRLGMTLNGVALGLACHAFLFADAIGWRVFEIGAAFVVLFLAFLATSKAE